jgi:hypothetical protein
MRRKSFCFFACIREAAKLKMNRTKKKCKKFLVNRQKINFCGLREKNQLKGYTLKTEINAVTCAPPITACEQVTHNRAGAKNFCALDTSLDGKRR